MASSTGTIAALPRSTPEEQGVASAAIQKFVRQAERRSLELHSLMLLRHGHVIADGWWAPYASGNQQLVYSVSKSFTATAIGIAESEGRLDVTERVASFFPDSLPRSVSPHLGAMEVRHLLMMATGHASDTIDRMIAEYPDDLVRGFLSIPPEYEPGSIFVYNNGATHMLAAILQKVTGEDLLNYLRPRLLSPLGILGAQWQSATSGIPLGFSGLHVTTESIARFGQLLLNRGEWNGRQLLSDSWITRATAVQISNAAEPNPDWGQGYGYHLWRSKHGYRADGAFGQFCLVLPEYDAVIVTTAATEDMQGLLDLVWEVLLPAFHNGELPPHRDGADLATSLTSLRLPPVTGSAEPVEPVQIPGVTVSGPFELPFVPFESVSVDRYADSWALMISSDDRVHRLDCAVDVWSRHEIADKHGNVVPVAASGGWTGAREFTAELVYSDSPHRLRVVWRPDAEGVPIQLAWNVPPLHALS